MITGCDMIVALEPENLFYMTGFWGEAIGILEKNGKTTIIAPELEIGRAKEEGIDCKVIQSDRGMSFIGNIKEIFERKGVYRLSELFCNAITKKIISKN